MGLSRDHQTDKTERRTEGLVDYLANCDSIILPWVQLIKLLLRSATRSRSNLIC